MTASTNRRWLVLRLEAPLLSFGGVAIDAYGVTWDFPALSMLTGLFANALGYERTERMAHQALQDRLIAASRREDALYHGTLTDVQNVHMQKFDKGWTTRGQPEGRDGGSYGGPHRRFRDYHPDALVAVVVTLTPATPSVRHDSRPAPSLDDIARALDRPERPLFIGRKPCLPARPINAGFVGASTAHEALSLLPLLNPVSRPTHRRGRSERDAAKMIELRAQWPATEGPTDGDKVDRGIALADRRNWISGLHGGTRQVIEGRITTPSPEREAAR